MANRVGETARQKKSNQSRIFIILGFFLLIFLVWAFVHYYYDNPTRVFNEMLNNTLSTPSYTKTVYSSSGQQTSKQVISVETGAINRVIDNQTISVPGYSEGAIKIVTIGTPSADYSKYVEINTKAKDKDGHTISFSPVIGIWGISSPGGENLNEGQLFNQAIFDVVPMSNINPTLKKQFLNSIHKYQIYTFANNVKSQKINGRHYLIYNVTVKIGYLNVYLSQFAHAIGLSQYSDKQTTPTINTTEKVKFYVDIASRQLAKITNLGSNGTYVYSSYGAKLQITLPKKYIVSSSLESNIQSLINK